VWFGAGIVVQFTITQFHLSLVWINKQTLVAARMCTRTYTTDVEDI